MLIEGQRRRRTPTEAREHGIAMVFQETSLVPTMTVAQNLSSARRRFFNRLRGIYIAAQQFMQSLHSTSTPPRSSQARRRAEADGGDRTRRAAQRPGHHLRRTDRDLTPEEKKHFFDLMRTLKKRGVSVIFISHALEEALQVSDRITILRDGKHVVTDQTRQFDRERIVQAMVGRDLSRRLYGQRKTSVRRAGRAGAGGAEPVDGRW